MEKKNVPKGKVDISNNVNIKKVEDVDMGPQKALGFDFEFVSKYEPKIAEIKLSGKLFFTDKPEVLKDVAKEWKKGKKIKKEVLIPVMNTILHRCHVEGIILSQQTGLPTPVPMPKIKPNKENQKYIG